MQLNIKKIEGDVDITGNVISLNGGRVYLADGTIIQPGSMPESKTKACCGASEPVKPFGDEPIEIEEIQISSFDTLSVYGSMTVEFSFGDYPFVIAEGSRSVLNQIVMENRGNTLEMGFDSNSDVENNQIRVKVVAPRISQIISSDSGVVYVSSIKNDGTIMIAGHRYSQIFISDLNCQTIYFSIDNGCQVVVDSLIASNAVISKTVQVGKLIIKDSANTRNLFITAADGSKVKIAGASCDNIVAKLSCAAKAVLAGKASKVDFETINNSRIDAEELVVDDGKADASHMSRITANVQGRFESHSSLLARVSNSK